MAPAGSEAEEGEEEDDGPAFLGKEDIPPETLQLLEAIPPRPLGVAPLPYEEAAGPTGANPPPQLVLLLRLRLTRKNTSSGMWSSSPEKGGMGRCLEEDLPGSPNSWGSL